MISKSQDFFERFGIFERFLEFLRDFWGFFKEFLKDFKRVFGIFRNYSELFTDFWDFYKIFGFFDKIFV